MHLRYEMPQSDCDHPQDIMRKLGITYQHATPKSIFDQWWFWNCENVPTPLPEGFSELCRDPHSAIGHGLSREQADWIAGLCGTSRSDEIRDQLRRGVSYGTGASLRAELLKIALSSYVPQHTDEEYMAWIGEHMPSFRQCSSSSTNHVHYMELFSESSQHVYGDCLRECLDSAMRAAVASGSEEFTFAPTRMGVMARIKAFYSEHGRWPVRICFTPRQTTCILRETDNLDEHALSHGSQRPETLMGMEVVWDAPAFELS
jgi:hypothetical protein